MNSKVVELKIKLEILNELIWFDVSVMWCVMCVSWCKVSQLLRVEVSKRDYESGNESCRGLLSGAQASSKLCVLHS